MSKPVESFDWKSRDEIECVRDIGRLGTLSDTHELIYEGFLRLKGEGKIDSNAYQDLENMRSEVFWAVYDSIARNEGEK